MPNRTGFWSALVWLLVLSGCGSDKINTGGSGDFSSKGGLHHARVNHSATLLSDGKVMVIGGASIDSDEGNLTSAETYEPATGLFTLTEDTMAFRRSEHHAVLLQDGRVLIVGGGKATAEIYDPATDRFTTTGQLNIVDRVRSVVRVRSGGVLVVGEDERFYELYNPTTEEFESFSPFRFQGQFRPSRRIGSTATLLSDNRVLVVGTILSGAGIRGLRGYAEIFDFGLEDIQFYLFDLRFGHTVTLLRDGRVLIAGGSTTVENRVSGTFSPTRTAELFLPDDGSFSPTGNMVSPRFDHSSILLADGSVLMIGGFEGDAEIYDPTSGQFRELNSDLGRVRSGFSTTLLPDGNVLIVGGYGENFIPRERAALFKP